MVVKLLAIYSSIYGGITTYLTTMVIPMDDNNRMGKGGGFENWIVGFQSLMSFGSMVMKDDERGRGVRGRRGLQFGPCNIVLK